MSIQKANTTPTHISQHLQELINVANSSVKTLAEQILEIYNTAKLEGFTPQEARILIDERVVSVSSRYLREVLPDEAKETKYTPKKRNSDVEPVPPPPKIPNNYQIKDAETVIEEEHDLPEPTQELPSDDDDSDQSQDVIYDKDMVNRYVKEIARLEEENTRLRIAKVPTFGNKFDFEYDLEVRDQILPLIVTAFPDKKTGYVRLDKKRLEKKK